jgi:modulator of FtsH protease
MPINSIAISDQDSIFATNKVLKDTCRLLAMTLFFSAGCAYVTMALHLPHPGIILTMMGYLGLLYLTNRFSDSALGLVFVFALTGFMGMTLGPILNLYLNAFGNGHQLILMAFGGTGVVFLGVSAYAMMTQKDFSYMTSFLMTGVWVTFFASLAVVLFPMPVFSLLVSALSIIVMTGIILLQTSAIINGGETNYLMATVALYVSLFNLLVSLLQLLGVIAGED